MNATITKSYKFYPIISMLYITLMIAANVLIYKIIKVADFTLTVGSLITPMWFIIGDIVTEVYGYIECRRLIWRTFICSAIFTMICWGFISIPSPVNHQNVQQYFGYILGGLPKIFFVSILGIFTGSFINAFIISKYKILVKGKYLWLRLLGSSFIGQLIFTVITLFLNLFNQVLNNELVEMIFISYLIKIVVLITIAYPMCFVIYFLKQSEGIDVYDYNTDFNPFKFD